MFENESSPLEQYIPSYFPPRFVRNDRSLWFNRTHIGLQLFFHDQQGHFMRLELSAGPIGDLMNMTSQQIQLKQLDIGGLKVDVTNIKPSLKSKRKEGPPLISANWERGEVYFRLQTDGLGLEELKKIVASTIR
jgi:hypothetical protein